MKYLYEISRPYYRELYQEETASMPLPMREAFIFQKYLENIPLYIEPGDVIAGWYGYIDEKPEGERAYEEARRDQEAEESRKWRESPRGILTEKYCWRAEGYDRGHALMDFEKMIARGTRAYIRDVDARLETVDAESSEGIYLAAMKASLIAGEILSARFAALAGEMAAQAADEADKIRLQKIERLCRKLPMEPAEDFHEALQSAYLLYSLICIADGSWISISFGSFDQYMYPYYLKSKNAGVSDSEMEEMLVCFFRMLDLYSGWDCALSVGGVHKDGSDATNDLSYLLVSAEKKSGLRAPLFCVRVNPNTPERLMDEVVCSKLFEMGQPTFYSEYECRKAVMTRGIDEEEASRYHIHTCMQLEFPADQVAAAWGIVTNMHLPLELALNGGKPISGELPIELKTPPKTGYASVDEILAQYRLYFRELFEYVRDLMFWDVRERRLAEPCPWLSAVTNGCIEQGRDRWDGATKYFDVTVETFGFANAADALGAVEQLVLKEKKYTIEELITAAANNYVGYEQIHRDIMKCPKYGMNIEEADDKARRILDVTEAVCAENRRDNIRFLPSLHTLDLDVAFGKTVAAMLDGRLSGEPFNKNAGPANAARCAGPTAMAMSACRINQRRLSGGQALDVHLAIRNIDSLEKRRKIAAYIRTYLASGGLQMQVNALSSETLKKAYAQPERYQDLIVRIGGHSRYYNDLPDDVKREFIHRISVEEGSVS